MTFGDLHHLLLVDHDAERSRAGWSPSLGRSYSTARRPICLDEVVDHRYGPGAVERVQGGQGLRRGSACTAAHIAHSADSNWKTPEVSAPMEDLLVSLRVVQSNGGEIEVHTGST